MIALKLIQSVILAYWIGNISAEELVKKKNAPAIKHIPDIVRNIVGLIN